MEAGTRKGREDSEATASNGGRAGRVRALILEKGADVSPALAPMLLRLGFRQLLVRQGNLPLWRANVPEADVVFFDGRGIPGEQLLAALEILSPMRVVVLGERASSGVVFRLARAGAYGYLDLPFTEGDVQQCFLPDRDSEHRLKGIARCLVGEMTLKEVQGCVRTVMLERALERADGSRRSAARLLGVTRPAVQKMLREVRPDEAVSTGPAVSANGARRR